MINKTEKIPEYLDRQQANITILTRAKLVQDDTLQITLQRMFERDDIEKGAPTRLRKQYRHWLNSSAPLIIICNVFGYYQILGTNYSLLEQDLIGLLADPKKRKGDIHTEAFGSDELAKCMEKILSNLPERGSD